MQYTIFIRKAPDGFYIASCPLIPEAEAQGETYEEALGSIKDATRLHIEARQALGEPVPIEVAVGEVRVVA